MFIAVPKDLKNKAKDVSPSRKRLQAVEIQNDEGNLLIINAYFPQDPKTQNYNFDSDFEEVLADIDNLIQSNCCNVVVAGDHNTDYKRDNGRCKRLDSFLADNSLESAWNIFEADYTQEFEINNVTYTSFYGMKT